jgi:putative endonuclease
MSGSTVDFRSLSRREVGVLGEKIAAQYLKKEGFALKDQNFRTKAGETDIIVVKDKRWHFVEVKTVVKEHFKETDEGHLPEEMVHEKKLETIVRVAELYAMRHLDENDPWQVDVVAVTLESSSGKAFVKYLPGVL